MLSILRLDGGCCRLCTTLTPASQRGLALSSLRIHETQTMPLLRQMER